LRLSTLNVLLWSPPVLALNPSLDVSQYAHTAWTVRSGFIKGNIYAITRTPGGYLWLGTEFGLVRFDGVRSISWQPPAGQHLPDGLTRWKNGQTSFFRKANGLPDDAANSLFEDYRGRIQALTQRELAYFKDGRFVAVNAVCGGQVHLITGDKAVA
jgi:hypothetical protein